MIGALYANYRFIATAIALLVVAGLAGLLSRPQLEDPPTQVRWGYITTELPGASPSEVESQITEPLEQAVRETRGIRSIDSSSLRGVSIVFVRLQDTAQNVEAAWSKIQDKILDAAKRLPPEAGQPTLVDERRWESYTSVVALVAQEPNISAALLARWSKELENHLRFVPGTQYTEIFGLPQEEIQVELSAFELASSKLTIAEVAQRIAQRDSNQPDATSQTKAQVVPVRLTGDIDNLSSLREVVLKDGPDAKQLRLAAVADIRYAEHAPPRQCAQVNGARAVAIATRMDRQENMTAWAQRHEAALQDFSEQLPHGIVLRKVFRQNIYTAERYRVLLTELAVGMTLVCVVTGLMMGWRAALPICSSMPLAILGTFFLMIPFGITLNQMSIAGLIIALGVLDSNGIIVVDDLQRRLQANIAPVTAIKESISHLAVPMIGSNLLSILGFAPAYFLPGPTGEFLGQLAWSVDVSLASSVIVSLGIIPFLTVWFLPQPAAHPPQRRLFTKVSSTYRKLLEQCFRYPLPTVLLSLLVPVFGFVVAPQLPEQFFPEAERDHFHFTVRLPSGASIQETLLAMEQARQVLRQHPEVDSVFSVAGTNAPMIHYSMVAADENRPNFAQAIVQLNLRRVAAPFIRNVQAELESAIPQAQVVVTWIELGPPVAAPIEFRVLGPSLEVLAERGEEARRLLADVPGVVTCRASLDAGGPQWGLSVLQHEAAVLGMPDEFVAEQLRYQLDGVAITNMSEQAEEIPIRVKLTHSERVSPNELLSLPLVSGMSLDRQVIPLASIAEWSVEHEPYHIHRHNGTRCNVIYGYVSAGELPIELEQEFRQRLADEDWSLPPGYQTEFGGISDERNSDVANLGGYSLVIAVVMTGILVIVFRSYRLSALIASVAFLSIGLGLLTLWISQFPIGLAALIGILGMTGVAVNDSVMVLEEVTHAWREYGTVSAVADAVHIATRHVIATTVTAMVGLAPLVFTDGGFWPPLTIVIVGGVGGATLLALILVPASFLLITHRPVSQHG